jgi:predicted dehydrogenase
MAKGKGRGRAREIRVGVVGVGRGLSMGAAGASGLRLVALCDTWEERLATAGERLGVATYVDYERFLEHDFDAVILANYFHQHAPFAIRALAAGKHVMSETAACHTLAEGVALVRAVEKSGCIYMFAENYPYSAYNQEMRRLYLKGTVGDFRYGEGEYVHPDPAEVKLGRSCGFDHWRNWIPATYYCTHSLAPVMFITDTRPEKVNGFVVPYDVDDPTMALTAKLSDTCAAILCRMDNGAVVKSLHGSLRGHGNYVRIHGNKGLMESCRHGDRQRLRVWREPWEKRRGEPTEIVYKPDFPVHHDRATRAGHGGGDFFTGYHFAAAIRTGEPPWLDVYRGVDMSIAGVQAWRSALADSAPMEVPDFRREGPRRKYRNDHWSPDPERAGPGQPASSILGTLSPSRAARRLARQVWATKGYVDD